MVVCAQPANPDREPRVDFGSERHASRPFEPHARLELDHDQLRISSSKSSNSSIEQGSACACPFRSNAAQISEAFCTCSLLGPSSSQDIGIALLVAGSSFSVAPLDVAASHCTT